MGRRRDPDAAPSKHTGIKIPADVWARLDAQVKRQREARGEYSTSAAIKWAIVDWLKAREAE